MPAIAHRVDDMRAGSGQCRQRRLTQENAHALRILKCIAGHRRGHHTAQRTDHAQTGRSRHLFHHTPQRSEIVRRDVRVVVPHNLRMAGIDEQRRLRLVGVGSDELQTR